LAFQRRFGAKGEKANRLKIAMEPVVTFHRFIPQAMQPIRADRGALGTLPVAAFQFCEAVTQASAFGWYAFPPMDFMVEFDGARFVWTHEGEEDWFPVGSEHFPGFDAEFDAVAPEDMRGYAPPFLTALAQPGVLQVWTGIMIRTRPGWSSLIRPVANFARSHDYEPYEGIIETDRWFYPLFINLRMIKASAVFSRHTPLLQIQPLKRDTYDETTLKSAMFLGGLEGMNSKDWDDFRKSVVERPMTVGRYARDVRKRNSLGLPEAGAA
jgi:hypothetical protein